MAPMIRTALRMNQAGQALFRMIAALGPKAYETAVLLTQFDFDITRAALLHGLEGNCRECQGAQEREAIRGCNGCVAMMRQRVRRLQDRVNQILGPESPTTRHRRPVVMFGADRATMDEGRLSIYETARAEGPEDGEL